MSSTAASKKQPSILGTLFFILYLLLLFYLLFLSEDMGRVDTDEYRYNLTLLKEIKRFYEYRDVLGWKTYAINVWGNVVAFMPFGFFLPMLRTKRKNIFLATMWGFILSVFVEVIQLCLQLGSFDVDDILLNTIGTFLGACIYAIVRAIRKKRS